MTDRGALIRELTAAEGKSPQELFRRLCRLFGPEDDLSILHSAYSLFSARKESLRLPYRLKIALGGTGTLNYLRDALELFLAREGIRAEIWLADFGTFPQQCLDASSPLYAFGPDLIWIFSCARELRPDPEPGAELRMLRSLWSAIRRSSSAQILQNNFDTPAVRAFGHQERRIPDSACARGAALNHELDSLAGPELALFDLEWVSSLYGKAKWHSERFWLHGAFPFDPDATALVAHHGAKVICGLRGAAKKCIALDLDNTLWGGEVGEIGPAAVQVGEGSAAGKAFAAFQRYLSTLKERGILLAACSKNDERNAKLPFGSTPGMVLKLEDFSAFRASWDDKAESLREIASRLGIGLDSIVFVDDSPFERNLVREILPEVAVPELPEDPADFVSALESGRYFELSPPSPEDKSRTVLYRQNALREEERTKYSSVEEFLAGLEMRCSPLPLSESNLERFAQLINKTNQFNLTGEKRPVAFLRAVLGDDRHIARAYRLTDRFGDNGIVSAVLLQHGEKGSGILSIENWVMSCRVLQRGLEYFVHDDLVEVARAAGAAKIVGRLTHTGKNAMVADLYRRLGYHRVGPGGETETWELDLGQAFHSVPTFITRADPS